MIMIVFWKSCGFGLVVLSILLGYRDSFAAELIMVERPNCEWCEIWEKEVGIIYKLTPQGKQAPIRRITIETLEAGFLKTKRPVVFTPTFILSRKQREIERITGYPGESHFWSLLEDMLNRLPDTTSHRCSGSGLKPDQARVPAEKHVC